VSGLGAPYRTPARPAPPSDAFEGALGADDDAIVALMLFVAGGVPVVFALLHGAWSAGPSVGLLMSGFGGRELWRLSSRHYR